MNAEDLVLNFKKGMANLSKTECRVRDMFNVEPPYMDYWAAPAVQRR